LYKDIKERNISTEEGIVQKLDVEELHDESFSTYFQADLEKLDGDKNYVPVSSIITIIPATGKCLPMFYLSNKKFCSNKISIWSDLFFSR
jgi:hypothetical protein